MVWELAWAKDHSQRSLHVFSSFGEEGNLMPWIQAGLCLLPLVPETNPKCLYFTVTGTVKANLMKRLIMWQVDLVRLNW